jgi:ABC-type polar amino acid transport system ATPase subunit
MPLGNALVWTTHIDNSQLNKDAKKTQGIIGKMGSGLTSMLGGLGGFAAIAAGAGIALNKIIQTNIAFEKSLSELQSITGVTTQELAFFSEEAIRMANVSTQSAQSITKGFPRRAEKLLWS